jgi:MFS family permease
VSRRGRRPLGLGGLYVQVALLHASYAVVRPMVSYRALELGAGSVVLGVLAATFAVLPLFLAFAVGRRADALGPRRLLVVGSLLLVAGSSAALLAPGLVVLVLAAAVLGMGHLFDVVGQQSVVARLENGTDRDRGFGVMTSWASVGQTVGPAVALSLAGWLATERWSAAVVGLAIAGLIAAAAVPLCLRGARGATAERRPAAERPPSRQALGVLLRTDGMWQVMLTSGMVFAALDLLMAYLPAWAEERGISVATVGWLLGLRALVSMVSRALVVWLIERFTRRWTFIGSLVCGVVGLAVLPFVGVGGAALMMVLLGIGLGLAQPLTMSWVSAMSAPELRGAAVGLRVTANRFAQTVIPPAIGAAAASAGSSGVFLASAVVLAAATSTVLRRQPG